MPWLQTQLVAGDWNKDGFGDLATLTSLDDGSTHVGVLRSNAEFVGAPRTLAWSFDAWVTPAAELANAACTECWPLTGMPTASGSPVSSRPHAGKITNETTTRTSRG